MIKLQSKRLTLSLRFALAFAALLVIQASAFAQTDTGRIAGTVRDPNSAVVSGATVVVRNERTNEERTVAASDEGVFQVPALKASTYTVVVNAPNFASSTASAVQLNVGQELTLDLTLQVAGATSTINVTDSSESTLDTGSARIGANVNQREVEGLPINGRQLSQLELQAPGSVNSGSGTFGDIRFSGRASQQNAVRYDGIEGTAIIDASPGNLNGEVPSPFRLQLSLENVQEFRVDSNSYPAEFGTGTGGQISVVTKSGSNNFHGSLFEYFRNSSLDAANFFDNIVGQKAPLRLNQFGGSIGGPIVKDKLFFFGSYEGYRLRSGLNSVEAAPQLRFAAPGATFLNSQGVATAVNPAIQPLIASFRDPRAVIIGRSSDNNFDVLQLQASNAVNENSFAARFDYRINDQNSAYFRFFRDQGNNNQPEGVTGRRIVIRDIPQNGVFALQSTLSSRLLNEFKIGYNSALSRINGVAPTVGGVDFSGIALNISGNTANFSLPGQGSSAGTAVPGGLVRANSATNGRGQPYTPYSISFIDNVNYTRGNHSYKFGGEIRPIRLFTDRQGGITYTYSNLQSFLAGTLQSVQYAGDVSAPSPFDGSVGQPQARQTYYIAYAQDEWKLRPNLTLNLGLRYEYYSPLGERNNRQVFFDITNGTLLPPTGDYLQSSKHNFGPRIALTYSPNSGGAGFFGGGRTVLRGGFGIYYGPGQTEDQIQPIESVRAISTLSAASASTNINGQELFAFQNDTNAAFANFLTFFNNNPNTRAFQPRAYAPDYTIPERVYQYSFSLQQELPYKLNATVAYVGSQGRNLFLRSIANTILPGQTSIVNNSNIPAGVGIVNRTDPATGRVIGVTTVRQFAIVNGATVQNPFAEIDYKTSGGSDHYNALQTQLSRRLNSGLTMNAQYTLSRSFGNTSGSNEARTAANPFDFNADRSVNNFDVRNTFNLSALYELPFGRNKRYNLGSVGNAVFGNFEVGGIINARSGLPIEVAITRPDVVIQCTNAAAGCNAGEVRGLPGTINATTPLPAGFTAVINTPGGGASRNVRRPDLIAGVNPYLNNDRNLLNPAAFATPAPGTYGNLPRNALRGPNFKQFDLVLNKRFRFTETANVEFRSEFFNIFNQTNFANPSSRLNSALGTGANQLQPGQPFTQAAAGSTFGLLTQTVERTVGLGTNRQIQFALRLNF